ncbi:hypothetical protein M406DRAFT_231598, partial [Cryphonectria parasitica EP155]
SSVDPSTLTPEYVATNEAPEVLRILTVMTAISTLFCGLRIATRYHRSVESIGLDDWLLVAAVGLYVGGFIYPTVIATIKASVLAMYYRIFPTKFIKTGVICLGVFTAAWWVAVVLVTIFQCNPISAAWVLELQPSVNPTSKCINNNAFFIGNAVPNIFTDLCIMLLPLREVYKLHIRTSQKIALGGVFLLGIMVIVSSTLKLNVTVQLFSEEHADYTYGLKDFIIWAMVETAVGIISASLPPLRPLLNAGLRTLGISRNTSKNRSGRTDLVTIGGGSAKKSSK